MLTWIETLVASARRRRWIHLVVVHLRLLIGFAFLPSGLKKVLAQPFTAADNSGPFHDFLHAFHATGAFYQCVGVVQLTAATLLMTQRHATIGALIALPVLTVILAFCWSTGVVPTAIVVTLMFLGTLGLVLWDVDRWRGLLDRDDDPPRAPAPRPAAPVDLGLWRGCGLAILAVYAAVCLLAGGVYRPRGAEPDRPEFWALHGIVALPVITLLVERSRRRRARV